MMLMLMHYILLQTVASAAFPSSISISHSLLMLTAL